MSPFKSCPMTRPLRWIAMTVTGWLLVGAALTTAAAGPSRAVDVLPATAPPSQFPPAGILGLAFAPGQNAIATADAGGTIRIWDLATARVRQMFTGHTDDVMALAFSADGSRLASCSKDRTIRLWDAVTGECQRTIDLPTVKIWAGAAGPGAWPTKVGWGPGGRTVAATMGEGVAFWNTDSGAFLDYYKPTLNFYGVHEMACSPDGSRIAVTYSDRRVRVIDAVRRRDVMTLYQDSTPAPVAWSPDGRWIAVGCLDHAIRIWDAKTGKQTATLEGHLSPIVSLAFAPDSRRLASGAEDGLARLWDVEAGRCLRTMAGHVRSVTAVGFSADGSLAATGGSDQTLRLWDGANGRPILTLR